MKVPTKTPTPEQFKAARTRAGLTQREASIMIFGADNHRGVQNWETGARDCPLGQYILFLLMTGQITRRQALAAVKKRMQK